MATPVPYQGAPDVAPRDEPTPSVNIAANPAAFGVNVAEAARSMGQVVEGSGKELFDRAYAMQDLQVHTDVNARLADANNKQTQLLVDYHNLEGKNAVDGYDDFQKNLNQVRTQGGDGLSPVGQSYYDTESRNFTNRLNFSGASHAADEQKRYVVGAADANISSSMKVMQADPNNPQIAEASLQNIRDQVAHKFGDIGGMSPEEVKQKQNDAINEAVNGRIRSMARLDPISAQKLLDQGIKDGDLYGNDLTNLSWYVRNQRDVIGSRTTASQVLNGANPEGGPILRALFKNESGGSLTVENPQTTTSGHAQGVFQITTGTWHEFAARAGIDLAAWPDAKSAPYAIQAQMANVIPLGRWDKSTLAAMEAAGGKLDPHKTLGENLAANGEGLGKGIGAKPTLDDLTARGRAMAEDQFPGDTTYADIVEDRIITQYNKEQAIRRDTDFNNEQTVQGALLSGVGPDKKIPTSIEDLRLDPQASQAWDALEAQHPTELTRFLNQMSTNAKGDVAMTPERLNAWQKLSGEAVQDPQKFMSDTQDLSKVDLPRAQKQEIIRLQSSIYKKQDANPPLSHAMSILDQVGMLSASGLTKADDPENRALFAGVLSQALEAYQTANGKPMPDEEVKTTAQQLLANVGGGGFFHPFGGGGTPRFETIDQIPPEIAETIRQEYASRGVEPNDGLILQAYFAAQYRELYGKKTEAPKAGGYTPQRSPQTSPSLKTFQ